jgi:hypothetical protein
MSDSIFKINKLKGSINHDLWVIRIEALLTREGYLDVITSDITALTFEEHKLLEEKALKATSFIRLSLEDGPLLQTRFISNPVILWNTLKNLYEAKGFSSEFVLSKDFINTTLSSFKGNLELYINSFKRTISSLESKKIYSPNKF